MKAEREQDAREFWNRRAETFPRYEPGEHTYEAGVLRAMDEMGVFFAQKRILDVGCGCGQFTLRLAMQAKWVTGLDVSDNMLAILRADASLYDIENIDYVREDWLDFIPQRSYDCIFCSMTPALRSDEGKSRLLAYPGAQVVYTGFRERTQPPMIRGFYAAHNEKIKIFNSAIFMREWLDKQGIVPLTQTIPGEWQKRISVDDAVSLCMASGFRFATPPSEAAVREYVQGFVEGDGLIDDTTPYVIDILVWNVPHKGTNGGLG